MREIDESGGRALLENILEQLHVLLLDLQDFGAFDEQRSVVDEELYGAQESELDPVESESMELTREREKELRVCRTECARLREDVFGERDAVGEA